MDYARALEIISPSEGNIPWCYLDTKGYVTVGVGNALFTVDDAVKLPFMERGTDSPASGDEIAKDWEAVKNSKKGQRATYYKALTKCDMSQDDILKLFESRVDEFSAQLSRYFPEFETWPDGPQLATLDWVFNCGVGALTSTVHLKAALHAQDWKGAAAACHRAESSDHRNDQTKALFLEAA